MRRLPDSDGSTRWRVFVSHTSELRKFPAENSYVDEVERAISAAGHVIVNMADFPAADQPPAQLCIERVRSCEVYVGVLGTRYGTPVRDRPEVSYTELEFETATAAGLARLVFLLDTSAANVGIPVATLTDYEFGARQEAFRRRVQDSGLVTLSFASPAELGRLVERSLRELADARHCQDGGIERIPPSMQRKSRLERGDSLAVGQSLYSPDGRTRFTLGHDANMVVYRQGLEDICDTETANLGEPERLTLGEDGWLILYDVNRKKLWEKGPGGVRLEVQDNSHVVLYSAPGNPEPIWATTLFVKAGMLVRWLSPQERTQQRIVKIDTFVVHRLADHGSPEARLHIEATNLSEQAVGLKHWILDTGSQRLAGSPYEGQTTGDRLLQPNQLFGWTLEPDTLRQIRPPARVIVTLTSGEAIDAGIVNWKALSSAQTTSSVWKAVKRPRATLEEPTCRGTVTRCTPRRSPAAERGATSNRPMPPSMTSARLRGKHSGPLVTVT